MAKVTAPLFSFAASGQLAKVLVYSRWKGIKDVRSYAIPANPNSAAQQQQRGYFSFAVAAWHESLLVADDFEAWNRYAANRPSPQSGFNAAVGYLLDLLRSGIDNPKLAFDGGITDGGGGGVDLTAEFDTASGIDGGYFMWGYSPSSLINQAAAGFAAGVLTASISAVPFATIYMRPFATDGVDIEGSGGVYALKLGS